ncbi:MAG: hypothetical protein RIQ60_2955 [Pseudomonadota bacterium]
MQIVVVLQILLRIPICHPNRLERLIENFNDAALFYAGRYWHFNAKYLL